MLVLISYVLLINWSPRKKGIKKHICRLPRICPGQVCCFPSLLSCSFPSSKCREVSEQRQTVPACVMALCYTYPIRKMCCLHCVGCSVIVIAGGIGHDWAALAEMGVGWHWNTNVTWKLEVKKLADFGVWQILIPNTFVKEVCHYSIGAINTQGKFIVSEMPQFLVESLKFYIKQLKVKNNSMAVTIPLSK